MINFDENHNSQPQTLMSHSSAPGYQRNGLRDTPLRVEEPGEEELVDRPSPEHGRTKPDARVKVGLECEDLWRNLNPCMRHPGEVDISVIGI